MKGPAQWLRAPSLSLYGVVSVNNLTFGAIVTPVIELGVDSGAGRIAMPCAFCNLLRAAEA